MDETLIRAQQRELTRTGRYYRHVCWMAVPLLCMSCYFYGLRPLLLCGAAVITGNLCDRLVSLLRRRVYQSNDFSSESFALLIALLMPATVDWYAANMRRAAAKGFINATDCADYLTKKGMPFRDAYKLTGCMVSDCISKDKTLEELTLDEFKGYSALFENDIYDAIDLIKCCEGRTSYGGPSEASVKKQIELASAQLGAWEAANA